MQMLHVYIWQDTQSNEDRSYSPSNWYSNSNFYKTLMFWKYFLTPWVKVELDQRTSQGVKQTISLIIKQNHKLLLLTILTWFCVEVEFVIN